MARRYRRRRMGWSRMRGRMRRRMRRLYRRSRRSAWRAYYALRRRGRIVSRPRKSPGRRRWSMRLWR